MRVKVSCDVICKTRIAEDITILDHGHEYTFHRDAEGFINSIDIIADVTRPEAFYGKGMYFEGQTMVLEHAYDVEQNDRIIQEFQELESLLAFAHHLYRIKWDWPGREVLDLTDDEMRLVGLAKFKYPGPTPAAKDVGRQDLELIVGRLGHYSELTVLLSFFREGKNDFVNARHINAFHNFYFVMEGLYGNAKTKNEHVEREFKANGDCLAAFRFAVGQLNRECQPNFQKVMKYLEAKGKGTTYENLVKQVVNIRGVVHHYNRQSSITQATPFNHRDFEPWSQLLFFSCMRAVDLERQRLDAVRELLTQSLEEGDAQCE